MEIGVFHIALMFSFLIFIILVKRNHAFNYYFKVFAYHINFMLVATAAVPVSIFRPRDPANIRIFQRYLSWSMPLILSTTYEKRNTEFFEKLSEPAILLVNHQSNFDLAGIFQISPYRATYLAKRQLLYAGPFGLATWLCGLIFIDRLNQEQARETMEYAAKTIQDRQVKVWIFPEGTRNMNGSLLPFKRGAFHLAVQAQVPIYPVVFSSYRYFMDSKRRLMKPGKVVISALPPVVTTGMTADDVPALTNRIRESMLAEFTKISHDLQGEMKLAGISLLNY